MEEGTDEFERVYKAYYGDVFKAVYHKTSDRQTAEDITQDTFVAAFKLGEEFLAHPQPKLWLLRTAHYKLYELYRKAVPLQEEAEGSNQPISQKNWRKEDYLVINCRLKSYI